MRLAFLFPLLLSASVIGAQANAPQNVSPNDLVRRVVTNELHLDDNDHTHWMYEVVTTVPAPKKAKTVIETKNGSISYLDEIDGRPLTPQERSAEDDRIHRFISDPDLQRKARQAGASDDKKSAQLIGMLPDAFLFQYAGTVGSDTIKFSFHPNPDFTSHSAEEYVFHKMDGFVVINTKQNRLAEISGVLTNGVQFGGGLFGHLDPGGTFDVRREEIAPGYWAVTTLRVNMNGKILFFKTISEQQDEVHRRFQRISDATTLSQAEALAQKQYEQLARSGSHGGE